jgi:phage-related protein
MAEKRLIWLGSSLEDLRAFPSDVRRSAGYQLRRVQNGMMPSAWKPMGTIGPGVNEIRIHTQAEHRILYLARLPEAIYVLHAFEKRTRQIPRTETELARTRLAELMRVRSKRKER